MDWRRGLMLALTFAGASRSEAFLMTGHSHHRSPPRLESGELRAGLASDPEQTREISGTTRRRWLSRQLISGPASAAVLSTLSWTWQPQPSSADDAYAAGAPELPDERSGLMLLRVAEVAAFQEKLLRAVAAGIDIGIDLAPQQIVFGTTLLLKNSNLDGNIRLMISEELPRNQREPAIKNAVVAMNTFSEIIKDASELNEFTNEDLVRIADRYALSRKQLAEIFNLLPEKSKDRYYGYANALKDYEAQVAAGARTVVN